MAIFPNVPNVPGVPPLPRQFGVTLSVVELLLRDNVLGLFGLLTPTWGVFLNGFPVLTPDNVIQFGFRDSFALADYPIEQGSFETYDKVDNPFDIRITMSCGGNDATRQAFLEQVEVVANSFQLYDVVTPEKTYTNVNFRQYDYRRSATNGNGLIVVDLIGQEIRETAIATFSQTKVPSAAAPIGAGTIQTRAPTGSELNASTGTGIVGADNRIEIRPGGKVQ